MLIMIPETVQEDISKEYNQAETSDDAWRKLKAANRSSLKPKVKNDDE